MKFLRKAMALTLALLLLVSMFPVSVAAGCVEGCGDGYHAEGCIPDTTPEPPPPPTCDGSAGCLAGTHNGSCLKWINDQLALCSADIGCGAPMHKEGCRQVILNSCNESADCQNALHKSTCKSLCGNSEGCTSAAHRETCIRLCGKAVGCSAQTHYGDCLSYCNDGENCPAAAHTATCLIHCNMQSGCTAQAHREGCQKVLDDAERAQCTLAGDCGRRLHQPACKSLCSTVDSCSALAHKDDCITLCGRGENCGAQTHYSNCLSLCDTQESCTAEAHKEICLTRCSKLSNCTATNHTENCQKALDDAERALCDETAACARTVHKPTCVSLCRTSVGCTALNHKEDCIILCTKAENCGAQTHYRDCLTNCTKALDCPAPNHKGGCQKAAADAAKAAALQAELNGKLEAMRPWLSKTLLNEDEFKAFKAEWEAVNKFAQENKITPTNAQQDLFSRLGNHLTAVTPTDYTVTFMNDSTSYKVLTVTSGKAIPLPANPTKTGYTFDGWSETNGGAAAAIPAQMPAKHLTYYARWKVNKYSITFDTDGGTPIATITADYGTTVTGPATPTKTGYTFKGWVYPTGGSATVPATIPASNVILKATWEANKYTIIFAAGDGSGTMASMEVAYDTTVNLIPNAFTNGSKNFAYWTLDSNKYANGAPIKNLAASGSVILTANWTDKTVLEHDTKAHVTTYNGQPQGYPVKQGFVPYYKVNGAFTTTTPTDAGVYDVHLTADATDTTEAYSTVIPAGLIINRKVLTATYESETIYAGHNPALTVLVSGFVPGEHPGNAAGYAHPKVTPTSTNIGTYTLVPYGGAAKNYTFNNVPGTLKVIEKVVYVYCHYKLLQTGQLNWPVPVMGAAGTAAMSLSLWFLLRKKKERHEQG